MRKTKMVVTRSAAELAKALGLTPVDGAEIALRSELNSKIAKIVQHKRLTQAQVAAWPALRGRASRRSLTATLRMFPRTCCCAFFMRWATRRKSLSRKRLELHNSAMISIGEE